MKAIQYCSELIEGNEVGSYRLVRDPERLCELFSRLIKRIRRLFLSLL